MRTKKIKLVAGVGIFAALAVIVSFATSFIRVQFLSLDAGDIIIVLASFIYGPLAGILISAVSSIISVIYSGTGVWGLIMDFVSSAVFAFVASFIYSRKRSFKTAMIGIYSSVVAVTLVMIPMNILITPIFTNKPSSVIIALIPTLLLPFNFFKTLFNGGAVLLVYKPIVRAMRKGGLLDKSSTPCDGQISHLSRSSNTVLALVLGGVSVVIAIAALIVLDNITVSF